MTKLNSTTNILSDLDGVILDLNYDITFWKEWLPEVLKEKGHGTLEQITAELKEHMKAQEDGLNWYDLSFWDQLYDVDCLEIIKNQELKCSYLPGSLEALHKMHELNNPKYILTNGDPRLFGFKTETESFLKFFDGHICSMEVGYAKEQKEFWTLASLNLEVDLKNSIFIDDNFKVANRAASCGVGQVYWITPGRSKRLRNGIETFPSLRELAAAVF